MNYYERTDCRFCGSHRLSRYLDLGDQPPSNSFLTVEQVISERRYPLKVYLCSDCGLSQLTGVVSADSIFDDYQYLSSTSKALVRHYAGLASTLTTRFNLSAEDCVVDIGCNDGILLNGYPTGLKKTIGVEPSKVAKLAAEKGHKVYNSFFTESLARRIEADHGNAKIITATNVFAHIDDIHTVVEGIRRLLSKNGAFIIEAPYIVDTLDKNYFDTIYHEHLCYLSMSAIQTLMQKHGMRVFDVERVDLGASGPAIRVFCERDDGSNSCTSRVAEMLAYEDSWGLKKLERYQAFSKRLEIVRESLLRILGKLRKAGFKIGAYGAPAKGNTLLNTFQLGPEIITEGVAETNKIKQGKLMPGSHLPIVSEEEFVARKPDYALLLTWNYLDFFLQSSEYIKSGGKFVVPLPYPEVRPKKQC